jgi:hypothetical protein
MRYFPHIRSKALTVPCVAITLSVIGLPALAEAPAAREAFFGELHLHTDYSIDAYVFGTHIGPEDGLRYARGEAVTHPGGYEVQLRTPLDFAAVTDHSEYTGALPMADDPESALRQNSPLMANLLRFGTWANGHDLYKVLSISILKGMPLETLQGPEVAGKAWKQIVDLVGQYDEPGKFTSFPAWEWTATPQFKNLHRIVVFKDPAHAAESEFSSLDSTDPVALWQWMDAQRKIGNDVIGISHNGNLSDGVLYPRGRRLTGDPVDATYAEARMRHEPLAEISQVKGQSETTPGLSPEDEFADFNVFVWMLLGAKGKPTDYGSYLRLALRDGIAMQSAKGFNPYKFGFVGASDSHSAASSYRHDDYFGEHGTIDDTPEKRLSPIKVLNLDNRMVCPAGLTGVWAEENTREVLWGAILRKETYATSGLRMKVRLFGGWNLEPTALKRDDWVATGYANGVPMGGDLPARSSKTNEMAPTFFVEAQKDPTGPNLDRVQIVKGWAKHGQSFEKIYDVTWAGDRRPDPKTGRVPAIGSTVDVATARYENTLGTAELRGAWTDPDFDPAVDAFYYVRAIAIPWPRWSTIDAAKLKVSPPSVVPLEVQDRAWSSPIWYTPTQEDRKGAGPGYSVAGLASQGFRPLDDAQLRKLVVGNTVRVRNLTTDQKVEILYGVNGQRLILTVNGEAPSAIAMAGLPLAPQIGYEIRDGRLITTIDGTPFEVTVYYDGKRYLAARGEEYGFANYEVVPEKG